MADLIFIVPNDVLRPSEVYLESSDSFQDSRSIFSSEEEVKDERNISFTDKEDKVLDPEKSGKDQRDIFSLQETLFPSANPSILRLDLEENKVHTEEHSELNLSSGDYEEEEEQCEELGLGLEKEEVLRDIVLLSTSFPQVNVESTIPRLEPTCSVQDVENLKLVVVEANHPGQFYIHDINQICNLDIIEQELR